MKSIMNILSLLLVILALLAPDTFAAPTFHGNSKLMLEKVVERSPFLLQSKIRSKLLNQLGSGQVSENDVLEAIKKTTPSMFLSSAVETAKRYQR
jgi:hypothetical protein